MVKKVLLLSPVLLGLLLFELGGQSSEDAAVQLEQANAYVEDENYEQAEAIYKTVVTDYGGSDYALEAQKNLAILYIDWDKGPQAQAACERLITDFSSHPALPEVLYGLADEYHGRQKHKQAIELYQYIVDRWPEGDSALPARMDVVISNLELGNDAEPEAATDKLIADFAAHPDLPDVLYGLASQYQDWQKHEQARQLYQYIADTWPESDSALPARMGVVISNLELGNDAEAEAATDKLIADFAVHPDLPDVLYHLANEYQGWQRHEQARQLYQYIVDNRPESDSALPARMGVAISNIELGNDAEAEAATDKLIADFAAHPDLPDVLYGLASQYQGWQRHEQARQLYQYIVDTWPESDSALPARMGVVISNLELGNDSEAQAATDKLVTDFAGHPDLPDVLYGLASQYHGRQRQEQAIKLYQYIVDNRPESDMAVPAQMDVVISNLELGNDAEAEAATDKLIADFAAHPALPEALNGVAYKYRILQRYEQARQLYQHVIDNWPKAEHAILSRGGVIVADIGLGNDPNAQAAIDSLIADFNDHPALPEAVFIIGEQYYNKAFRCENEGLEAEARENFGKAIAVWGKIMTELPSSAPYTARAYCLAADCYRRLGQHEKSIEYYQRVVDDWPNYEYTWSALFRIGRNFVDLKKSGLMSESEADPIIKAVYEQLLEEYPTCKTARHARYWLSRHK